MTQAELELQIAELTGEDLREVRRHGFSISGPIVEDFDIDSDRQWPQVLDWDDDHPGTGPNVIRMDELIGRAA